MSMKKTWLSGICLLFFLTGAQAEVRVSNIFGDHMVLQRDKAVPVFGTASPGEQVTVKFHGQSLAAMADAHGNWEIKLTAMSADTHAQIMTIIGSNTIILDDVLIGDVWLCSGQSNMDMRLGDCNRQEDIGAADFPGIRSFRTPLAAAGSPQKMLKGDTKWVRCSPSSAGDFSATAFYFARKIYQENNAAIPIGLIVSSVGGTTIDVWLSPEGLVDLPVLKPLLSQPVMPNGPFGLSYGMIHPLAPYGIKGAIWYQGESGEKSVQSPDSYFLKMKALVQGWKRLWGMDVFPFYYVMIANYGERLETDTPVFHSGGWDADTRLQQVNALALPHAGCASAIDIGVSEVSWPGYHPKNKQDVGERLALWALKNDYGQPSLVACGPVLKDVSVSGSTVVCSFDNIGSGLMIGSKSWYKPTQEVPGGSLRRFVMAGADGKWYPANAIIKDNQVLMSSSSVPEPRQVSYACWQNPEGCNLYNREGLPTAPFYVEDVTKHYLITASVGTGGFITPVGTHSILPRMTTLYTIVPDAGYYIKDVTVDGVSVGSVKSYTFNPVYANHTIAASFTTVAPTYTITASAGGGGMLTPSGTVQVLQGDSKAFAIAANGENQASVAIDGTILGQRFGISFNDVRADHSISAAFSGMIKATSGYGGTISPDGAVLVPYGSNQTFAIAPILGYAIASVKVDGVNVMVAGDYTFTNVTTSHVIAATFKSVNDRETGSVPRRDQLIFACRSDALPAKGIATSWSAFFPDGKMLTSIGIPAVDVIDDRKYVRITSEAGDGFTVGSYAAPIVCNGASIIVVAKPIRNGAGAGWTSIVDLFYDRLVLGIRNDSGLVCVRRNGTVDNNDSPIPDGQITILSLVVQADGTYMVYANGKEIMSNVTPNAMTSIVPGVAGPYATSITVGRNAPDGWTTFNGDVGDIFVYKAALSQSERQKLEALIAKSLVRERPLR
jgi:sialate O-acetylesterase